MRLKRFLGLALGGFALAGAVTACGDGDSDTTGGTGGSPAGSTSSPSTGTPASSSSSTGPTSGTGGSSSCTPAFDNHSADKAADIAVNDAAATASCIANPAMSKDYYKFDGTAGESIAIFVSAKTLGIFPDGFAANIIDATVTLYDDQQKQIAFQDDPWPRDSTDPALFVRLPKDGTYTVLIQDCNTWQPMGCNPVAGIDTFGYELSIFDNTMLAVDAPEGAEPNDDTTSATVLPYPEISDGNYALQLLDASFEDGTDTDVYSLTIPADASTADGARMHADFWLQSSGPDTGNGSTSPIGKMWLTDSTGGVVLGSVDGTLYGDVDNPMNGPATMSVPAAAGTQYYLFVQHPPAAAGANDFYFVFHFGGTFYANPLETAEVANDDPATAEPMTVQENGDGSFSYFNDGNIISWTDVDHFAMDVPAGVATVSAFCSSARDGSGLQSFTFAVLNADGTPVAGASATEALDSEVNLDSVAIPAGATMLLLKLSATGQDATNTGTFYKCGIVFRP